MAVQKSKIQEHAIEEATSRRSPILLDPQPGEKWAALVDRQPVAYGKTLKEAKARALERRPEARPSLLLIADLWELGFFQPPVGDGETTERAPDL
ncbi:MAG: hypothetical protein KY468_14150 [Armatimonadetes bacterium]|nr:hypothetical protein [Armatimonadota bacterium]